MEFESRLGLQVPLRLLQQKDPMDLQVNHPKVYHRLQRRLYGAHMKGTRAHRFRIRANLLSEVVDLVVVEEAETVLQQTLPSGLLVVDKSRLGGWKKL
jgi:hypothetical protein